MGAASPLAEASKTSTESPTSLATNNSLRPGWKASPAGQSICFLVVDDDGVGVLYREIQVLPCLVYGDAGGPMRRDKGPVWGNIALGLPGEDHGLFDRVPVDSVDVAVAWIDVETALELHFGLHSA